MKIIYVTDIHGEVWKYERILEVAKELKVEAVINGGDMLNKETDNMFNQGSFIKDFLDEYFSAFDSNEIFYLSYLGNDDLKIFDEAFNELCNKHFFAVDLAQRKFKFDNGFEFIGFNMVVDYPFRLKDRCRMDTHKTDFPEQFGTGLFSTLSGFKEIEDWHSHAASINSIEEELSELIRPDYMKNTVYVIHMPPANLGLDVCYYGESVGSVAIYDFLKNNQPLLSLHGHIHESRKVSNKWFGNIGMTTCIQPGQLENLTYVVLDLETGEKELVIE